MQQVEAKVDLFTGERGASCLLTLIGDDTLRVETTTLQVLAFPLASCAITRLDEQRIELSTNSPLPSNIVIHFPTPQISQQWYDRIASSITKTTKAGEEEEQFDDFYADQCLDAPGSLPDLRYRASSFFPDALSLQEEDGRIFGLSSNALHFIAFCCILLLLAALGIALFVLAVRVIGKMSWKQVCVVSLAIAFGILGAFGLVLARQTARNKGRLLRRLSRADSQRLALASAREGVVVQRALSKNIHHLQGARVVALNCVPVFILDDISLPDTAAATASTDLWEFYSASQAELDGIALTYYLRMGYVCLAISLACLAGYPYMFWRR